MQDLVEVFAFTRGDLPALDRAHQNSRHIQQQHCGEHLQTSLDALYSHFVPGHPARKPAIN